MGTPRARAHRGRLRRAPFRTAVAVSACALWLAGCGAAPTAGGASRHGLPEVEARAVHGLGTIVVDGRRATLYAYVPDHRGRSPCYHQCASVWPPLLLPAGVTRPRAGPGVRASLLGTTRRRGGALQVTYGHWPLYTYARDHGAGAVTGQGSTMGLWYVVGVSGSIDRRPAPANEG